MTESTMPRDTDACLRFQEDLPLLGEGMLVTEEERALRSHLEGCAACQSEAAALQTLKLAMPQPPGDLGLKILAGLVSPTSSAAGIDEPGLVIPFVRKRQIPAGWGTAALAASLILAFIAGIGGGRFLPSDAAPGALDPLAFVDPDLDGWAEEWFVAGAPLLEALSDETLYLLAMEMNP